MTDLGPRPLDNHHNNSVASFWPYSTKLRPVPLRRFNASPPFVFNRRLYFNHLRQTFLRQIDSSRSGVPLTSTSALFSAVFAFSWCWFLFSEILVLLAEIYGFTLPDAFSTYLSLTRSARLNKLLYPNSLFYNSFLLAKTQPVVLQLCFGRTAAIQSGPRSISLTSSSLV